MAGSLLNTKEYMNIDMEEDIQNSANFQKPCTDMQGINRFLVVDFPQIYNLNKI